MLKSSGEILTIFSNSVNIVKTLFSYLSQSLYKDTFKNTHSFGEFMLTDILTFLFNNPSISYTMIFVSTATVIIADIICYTHSTYYKITHNPYYKVRGTLFGFYKDHKGAHGEYLIYNELKKFEKNGAKILFNCYVPKSNGQTSEIDILMIHTSGMYVFESKNYSGWIFGSENDKYWTQTLPSGKGKTQKSHFLNPMIQNQTHINALSNYMDKLPSVYSIVAFSNRCTFKNINGEFNHNCIIHREDIQKTINQIISSSQTSLSSDEIDQIYKKLYPLTQVSDDIKKKHIENISYYTK